MTTPLTSLSPNSIQAPASISAVNAGNRSVAPLGDEQVFLQLLVAQVRNQDPLNPTDSTTFVTQLAQFSGLEQLISINSAVSKISSVLSVDADSEQDSSTTVSKTDENASALRRSQLLDHP